MIFNYYDAFNQFESTRAGCEVILIIERLLRPLQFLQPAYRSR